MDGQLPWLIAARGMGRVVRGVHRVVLPAAQIEMGADVLPSRRHNGPAPGWYPGPAASTDGCTEHPLGHLGDRSQPLTKPPGVALFGTGQCLEPFGDLVESFVTGGTGKTRVHLRVLL